MVTGATSGIGKAYAHEVSRVGGGAGSLAGGGAWSLSYLLGCCQRTLPD